MNTFEIIPKVDETQEFIEIATDFSNPLDLVREAISNAYDAEATKITISFEVITQYGESILKIVMKDNGNGISQESLQNFFDLGNSTRRNDPLTIGEKGHGTKVYFNSRKIEVKTKPKNSEFGFFAVMDEPFRNLYDRKIPTVQVTISESIDYGTEITIYGYNNNRRDKFTHEILSDHVIWFTKHGSFDNQFRKNLTPVELKLKGLGANDFELIPQFHQFGKESTSINKLFEDHLTKAPDFFCKKITREGKLKNYPEIKYQAIFYIEGKYAKYSYNPMLRRPGYSAPEGAYTVQERYGLWIGKDFIPVQRQNSWITFKGSEYTKFHALINCQDLRLTANRGSIDNTPSEILHDLKEEVRKIYDSIVTGDEWTSMEWLEDEAYAYQTAEKEKNNFEWRQKKINKSNIAKYKGAILVEPDRESGVYSLFLIISQLEPKLFPFYIIDYDTHEGIDAIAKGDATTPIVNSKLYYIEFKRTLGKGFNHCFQHLHSVVCWDTEIKHDELVCDINKEERKMQIIPPENAKDYTRYYLDKPRSAHKIEVFCMKQFLKERLGIEFYPRTVEDVL